MDYIILIFFLVQLTVYRQEKEKRWKRMKLNSFRSCSKYKNSKKSSRIRQLKWIIVLEVE